MAPDQTRDHLIRELVDTETNYVKALNMIITGFSRPLEPFLRREESHILFGHIKDFYNYHSTFLSELVRAASRTYLTAPASGRNPLAALDLAPVNNGREPVKISSCFLSMKNKFLKYGEYCATLSATQALLEELNHKNESFSIQLDRCQQEANGGKFKLSDLFTLPVQRILRYHLLLENLIKETSATNDDYQGLKRAHETMVDLGRYINDVKRDTEAIQIINEIEQSISGLNLPPDTQLTDYGRLVRDGSIRIRVPHDLSKSSKLPNDAKTKQKRYVFLFDKVMLLCKLSGLRGYQYKEALVLSEFEVETSSSIGNHPHHNSHDTLLVQNKLATKDKWSHSFSLVRPTDKLTYTFLAKTLEERDDWVERIREAMDNIRPAVCRNSKSNHEFLMYTFDKASSCEHCGKLLLGLYYQGYRCRSCFLSVHKKCLSSSRPCKPALPPPRQPGMRLRCNEPSSPSIRSNCSDDVFNMFSPSSIVPTSAPTENEYNYIEEDDTEDEHQHLPPPLQTPPPPEVSDTVDHSISKLRICGGSIATSPVAWFAKSDRPDKDRQFFPNVAELADETSGLPFLSDSLRERVLTKENRSLVQANGTSNGFSPTNGCSRNGSVGGRQIYPPLKGYPWFRGQMDRERAETVLKGRPNGSFLVRVSPKHHGSYVISLNHNMQVKHMRIYVSKDNKFYLSQNRLFKDVVELVSWYENNSLVESFHMLDARLAIASKGGG